MSFTTQSFFGKLIQQPAFGVPNMHQMSSSLKIKDDVADPSYITSFENAMKNTKYKPVQICVNVYAKERPE